MNPRSVAAGVLLLVGLTTMLGGCAPGSGKDAVSASVPSAAARAEWAIAIHGGAGVMNREKMGDRAGEYEAALEAALRAGAEVLANGGSSLDAVETAVRLMEDDPLFNAGKGAVFTHEGRNELDAAIMDGRDRSCGAVTGVTAVKNPVTLARRVMEESRHVFFSGPGAEAFATEQGLERVDPSYYFTQRAWDSLQQVLAEKPETSDLDTVGCVALDREGNLAAATSTGGLTNKRFGRIGDVPVIGAGTYADNRSCAVSCTGIGEQYIRNTVARSVAALVEHAGLSLEEAVRKLLEETLEPGDGGIIAVSRTGELALMFNTGGMFRGAADSTGRFETGIW